MKGLVAVVVLLAGCPSRERPLPPRAPVTPVPITDLNSPYDDFNSANMQVDRTHWLVFSTNRGSQGHDFDLYGARLRWEPTLHVTTVTPFSTDLPKPFAPELMSPANERGPIELERTGDHVFAFASDREGGLGGLDLYTARCNAGGYSSDVPCGEPGNPVLWAALSSAADDAYVTRPFSGDFVLFASNRAGGTAMDIYDANWPVKPEDPTRVSLVKALSSTADDTAPSTYVTSGYDHEVVFVSNREGGLGEHDIYCSTFTSGTWSPPRNLGPAVNSSRDEYRPIVIRVDGTQFLIFSSTRDGGQGGYDLYAVGYPGCGT